MSAPARDPDSNSGVALRPIARNLRRWRTARQLTLAGLAREAGVAKSTVSLIERGQGNPSIETVWALAAALGVPFSTLFQEDPPVDEVAVVRSDDPSLVPVNHAGGDDLDIRHLLSRAGGTLIEIYTLALEKGAVRHATASVSGLFEHITVAAGTVEISSDTFTEVLRPGDLISFRADRPHSYRVLDGPVRLVSVHEYPKHGGS